MRILVISDSHNFVLESQINKIQEYEPFDLLIHCGDKYKDAEKFASKLNISEVKQVPGNCDSIDKPLIIEEVINGKRIIITHGHVHGVKGGLIKLIEYAKERNADAVLYGHTHCAHNEVIENILFFNPGSTISPKYGHESFGILQILNGEILSEIMSLEN